MLIVLPQWYLYFSCHVENIFKKVTKKLKEHKTSKDYRTHFFGKTFFLEKNDYLGVISCLIVGSTECGLN